MFLSLVIRGDMSATSGRKLELYSFFRLAKPTWNQGVISTEAISEDLHHKTSEESEFSFAPALPNKAALELRTAVRDVCY